MSPSLILSIIVVYFLILLLIAFIGRKDNDNYAFFLGKRQSPWYIVAFGMLGASISGISFISVPGMAAYSDFTYMQMVVGFSIGYVVIAYLLLPLYYKIGTTSIYEYLGMRFGIHSHRTGTCFFILSRALGGAARIFVAAVIIQTFVFGHWNIPFWLTSVILISLIYLYTFTNGIKTIVWTDALQTFFLLSALIVLVIQAFPLVSFKNVEMPQFVVFDINSKADFFKMLLSGIFITITMTGLDQDMMQKNLSCKSLRDAQKNMLSYRAAFIPINLLFLFLGWMLCIIYANNGQVLPAN
ncbi:MAG TPA: sodium:solute symporter, partial [Candidatus Enterocola sp.]|nr:sodium:solute symporter [Candidatus Enterocola sp.]